MDGIIAVIVDADACPRGAFNVMRRLRSTYRYRLVTVASFHHEIENTDHVMVGDAPEEADLAIVNLVRPGDIVVTHDWGLAALALGKGARCLSPNGYEYTADNIDFRLNERYIKAKHRRGGGRTRGPRARDGDDDNRFEKTFRRMFDPLTPD